MIYVWHCLSYSHGESVFVRLLLCLLVKYITERIFYYGKRISMENGARTNRV